MADDKVVPISGLDVVSEMAEFLRRAEEGETPLLLRAREVLASALVEGREVDEGRLKQLGLRVALKIRGNPTDSDEGVEALLVWGEFLGGIDDYIKHKQVLAPDGRCATAGGWKYPNGGPVVKTVVLPPDLNARLRAHVMAMIDAGKLEGREECVIATAIREYLDRQEK